MKLKQKSILANYNASQWAGDLFIVVQKWFTSQCSPMLGEKASYDKTKDEYVTYLFTWYKS